MVKIQGHTVGNDGVVYNPDTASFGYVGGLDSRNTEERRQEYIDAYKPVTGGPGIRDPKATAKAGSGPGAARVGGNSGSGPGSAAVISSPVSRGSQLRATVFLDPKLKETYGQLVIGGNRVAHNPGWSDAGEAEERWGDGDSPFSPTFMYQWGVASADMWTTMDHTNGGPLKTEKIARDLVNAPGVVRDGLLDFNSFLAETRRHVLHERQEQNRVDRNGKVVPFGGF